MPEVRGYALALRNAHGGCQWGSHGTAVGCDTNGSTGFNGYSSTQAIVAFSGDRGWNLQSVFPAVYHAKNYETACPAPDNSSGWFLPSGGQCQYWVDNKDVILTSILSAGGNGYNAYYYWSSSETGGNDAWFTDFYFNTVRPWAKNQDVAVRAVLAF